MAKSSIHFQGVKNNSEGHNLRLNSNLDYIFPELSVQNKNYIFTENIAENTTNAEHSKFLKNIVKEKTGRLAQEKAHMLQEGVFNFNENHTNEDIKKAIELFCIQVNLKPIRLSIHRDEGHTTEDGTRKLNLHAHLTVEWINRETGKSHKWNKQDASDCQTKLAECLGMERGKESTKRHLSALEWKIKQKQQESEDLDISAVKTLNFDNLCNLYLNQKDNFIKLYQNPVFKSRLDNFISEFSDKEKEVIGDLIYNFETIQENKLEEEKAEKTAESKAIYRKNLRDAMKADDNYKNTGYRRW